MKLSLELVINIMCIVKYLPWKPKHDTCIDQGHNVISHIIATCVAYYYVHVCGHAPVHM